MILQALYSYYHRIKETSDVPQFGFARQKLHFCLVLKRDGSLMQVKDIRDTSGKKPVPATLTVPAVLQKRAVGIMPQFLWDNTGYVLGIDGKGKPERTAEQHGAFVQLHKDIAKTCNDEGLTALLNFLRQWQPEDAAKLPQSKEILDNNIVFQLDGSREYVHDRPALKCAWIAHLESQASSTQAVCLITGVHAPIAKLNLPVKGVRGAQTSGASLCAFNLDAFRSFDKSQNYNAPMSPEAAFAYVTALNCLLQFGSGQSLLVADTTVVFWSERASPAEGFFGLLLNPTDDPGDVQSMRLLLESVRTGQWAVDIDPNTSFYVLGLAPNSSRLSVRFWQASSVQQFAARLAQHFSDLSIAGNSKTDPEYPPLWRLLRETAVQHKDDNIPPLLAGALLRAILTGAEYPLSFYTAILKRIRADHTINYIRAAALKAYLVRRYRLNNQPKEVPVSLDPNNKNPGYLLGRLFALLEKAQLDALGKVDATIKDRYYGAASSTPRAVFPVLLRLAQHHIAKAEYGAVRDKEIQTVVNDLQEFPAHLSLEEQGLFAIGYYHQRHAFYNKPTE